MEKCDKTLFKSELLYLRVREAVKCQNPVWMISRKRRRNGKVKPMPMPCGTLKPAAVITVVQAAAPRATCSSQPFVPAKKLWIPEVVTDK